MKILTNFWQWLELGPSVPDSEKYYLDIEAQRLAALKRRHEKALESLDRALSLLERCKWEITHEKIHIEGAIQRIDTELGYPEDNF